MLRSVDYDTASPTEESRRFRRALLERVRSELLSTAEREPAPVEQRLLRQVAGIIRRCETELLDSFYAQTPSRRASAFDSQPGIVQMPSRPAPQTAPQPEREPEAVSPRAGTQGQDAWQDLSFFSSSEWIDWSIEFPPGLDLQGVERGDGYGAVGAPVWTR